MTEPGPQRIRLIYRVGRMAAKGVLRLICRMKIIHADRVPATGPVLIVANHVSYLDPPLVGCDITQREVTYLARAGLFKVPLFGRLIRAVNSVPIREGQGDVRAIRDILERIKRGEAVLIFPEGSRSYDGAMVPFRSGASLIIRRAKCPVIPVGIDGAFDAWPRTKAFPKLGQRVLVLFGHPIPPEELMGAEGTRRLQREVDQLRLACRAELRRSSAGRYPAPGPADEPFSG